MGQNYDDNGIGQSVYRLHEEQYAAMTRTERMALQTSDPRSRLPVMFSPACKEHEISDADHTILTSHIGRLHFTDVGHLQSMIVGKESCLASTIVDKNTKRVLHNSWTLPAASRMQDSVAEISFVPVHGSALQASKSSTAKHQTHHIASLGSAETYGLNILFDNSSITPPLLQYL